MIFIETDTIIIKQLLIVSETAKAKKIQTRKVRFKLQKTVSKTKYECCYFEYDVGNETNKDWKTGCMKIYKDDEEDLNDLKYYVSKLSPNTVFNCRQSYLQINFIIVIILLKFIV